MVWVRPGTIWCPFKDSCLAEKWISISHTTMIRWSRRIKACWCVCWKLLPQICKYGGSRYLPPSNLLPKAQFTMFVTLAFPTTPLLGTQRAPMLIMAAVTTDVSPIFIIPRSTRCFYLDCQLGEAFARIPFCPYCIPCFTSGEETELFIFFRCSRWQEGRSNILLRLKTAALKCPLHTTYYFGLLVGTSLWRSSFFNFSLFSPLMNVQSRFCFRFKFWPSVFQDSTLVAQ